MHTVVFLQGAGEGAYDADALLAESLSHHLGEGFTVDFPRMPAEHDPDYELWRPAMAEAIRRATSPVVLVGHSAGGYMLMRYLADDFGALLPSGVPVFLYGSEEDAIVPLAHRDL